MRTLFRIVLVAAAVLLLAVICLPFLISANQFKPMLEAKLTTAMGREVAIGDLKLSLLSGGVAATGLSIADDPAFGQAPFVEAKSLKIGVELWTLLTSRKLVVTSLVAEQPQVTLLQSESGDWNYASLGAPPKHAGRGARVLPASYGDAPAAPSSGALDLGVQLLKITDGHFSLGKTAGRQKPLALENVEIEVRDFSAAAAFPFSLSAKVASGGAIKLEGTAGPIDMGNVPMTPVQLTLDVTALDLAGSPLAAQSPGLAGVVSFHGSGKSAAGSLTLDAALKAEHLRLAKGGQPAKPAMEFDFTLAHDMRKHAGALQRGDLHVGSALAHLTGTYEEKGDTDTLAMKFAGPAMPVQDLAELLPPLAVALPQGSSLQGGTATANFTVNGPPDKLVTAGSLAVNKTRLANFDLGGKMSAIETLAGIKGGPNTDIDNLAADVRMAPDGMTVSNLHFLAPAIGELSGAGTVSPANALNFKMSATLHTSGAAAILSKAAVPFVIQGTAQNPVFQPDVKGMANSAVQSLKQNPGQAVDSIMNLLGRKKKQQ
ncbi:MAG TPA: AsmA family protein [Bryobacteraceae bacterium]|nr:AsmA family protein [Bryobacteraceae bacterium]